ncbi:MAG: Crp/Fnr family transcriptional regulator [Anaerolineae bacterium]|nr:Crp/Fnr family transcriptional regulator [Anaerolineae bacterium]MCA9894494.1 Crp/Fnr family transcriptional regulator [Anaerolineae bacterium]
MVSSVKHYISSISYFEGLTEVELNYIVANSVLRRYEASEVIFLEGDLADGLWIVEKGRIKIYKLHPEGGEHILHLRGPGNTFNDIAALDGGYNPANATALSQDVRLWLVPTDTIAQVLSTNPQVAFNVIRLLAKRVRSLVGQIEDLALYSVLVRLARFLLKQVEDPNLSGPGVTRTAIAAHLNTTPQTISVALRELEAANAIEFDRHQIVIISEDALRAIAML